MRGIRQLIRRTSLLLASAVIISSAIIPEIAWGQTPSAAQPKIHYTRSSTFTLPVNMPADLRTKLSEVCLYVKSGSGNWVRQEVAPATIDAFSYKAPRDGEYWFSLATVDRTGKQTPADVNQEPPSLRVIIDTQAPVLEVQAGVAPDGDFCLKCKMIDANPDPASIKAVCRYDQNEVPLQPVPGQPGVFKFPSKDLYAHPVRVTGSDLCGNSASRDVQVKDLISAAMTAEKANEPANAAGKNEPRQLPPSIVKRETIPERTADEVSRPPMLPPVERSSATLPAPPGTCEADLGGRTVLPATSAPRQLLNTTQVSLDYRIDQVGPSGVGKVEIYLTSDNGQTWKRHAEDPDRRSPAEFVLPGEGVFGVRLVVTNGNGFGGNPPVRGDAPTCTIEVDTTPPYVQLRPIEPIAQNGCLEIHWTATDKNLGAEPVALYFRPRSDSPWQVMARNLKNDGVYRWAFPRDLGAQFHIKVEVTDLAGNVSRAETPNPVVLDMTEPRVSVIGITGMGGRAKE